MGIVESLAFMPPNRDKAKELLRNANVTYLTNSVGHRIASIRFEGRSDITCIYSHGNAEDIAVAYPYFQELCSAMGVNLVVYDYSGYGTSGGVCSEANTYSCINAVFTHVTTTLKVPVDRVVLMGRSLGSGPTVDLASRTRGLGGVILQSALTTAMSTTMFSIGFMDIFNNANKIEMITDCPVYCMHGDADTVVPFTHGQQLYNQLLQKKSRTFIGPTEPFWVKNAGHNDVEYVAGPAFYDGLRRFVDDVRKKRYLVEAGARPE